MTKKEYLQLFEEKKVRTVWDDKEEKMVFLHCGCVRWIATKTHDETPQKLQMKYLKNYK